MEDGQIFTIFSATLACRKTNRVLPLSTPVSLRRTIPLSLWVKILRGTLQHCQILRYWILYTCGVVSRIGELNNMEKYSISVANLKSRYSLHLNCRKMLRYLVWTTILRRMVQYFYFLYDYLNMTTSPARQDQGRQNHQPLPKTK